MDNIELLEYLKNDEKLFNKLTATSSDDSIADQLCLLNLSMRSILLMMTAIAERMPQPKDPS